MKILLLGKNGQLGWELQRSLAPLGEVISLDFDSSDHCADFSQPEAVARTVRELRPQVVVNAAAHTAVDQAQSEPDRARLINAITPGALAQAAHAVGAWMLHYSTDYVFDGTGTSPWREADATAPLNVYGATKREGELLVQQHCPRHLILRTSWVYAARGGNFAKTMLRLAQERDQLRVIDDQIGAPTGAELLADVSAHALCSVLTEDAALASLAGLYHVTARGETSWYGYAQYVLQTAARAGCSLKVQAEQVQPIATSAYPTPAQRPLNSRLDCSHFQAVFGLNLPPWQLGVQRMLHEML